MSEPVLHKGNVCAGVQQVSSYGMFERVKFALLGGQLCSFAVHLHQVPEGAAVNRDVSVGDEEIRRVVFAGEEVGAESFLEVWLEGIDTRERPFEPSNGN